MFKTCISFFLAISLCVCSVGCGATTGPLADPFKNQVDSTSVSGVADDGSSKKEEYNMVKDVTLALTIFVSAALFCSLTVAFAFKAAEED